MLTFRFAASLHVVLRYLAGIAINLADTALLLAEYTRSGVATWPSCVLENVNQVAQTAAELSKVPACKSLPLHWLAWLPQRAAVLRWTNRGARISTDSKLTRRAAPQLHYRSTLRPLAGWVSSAIATILNSAVPYDVRYKNIAAAYPSSPEQLSLADLWDYAANIALIFILVRFLLAAAASTFVRNHLRHLYQLSPRIVLFPSLSTLRAIVLHVPTDASRTSRLILEILALPVFVVHQLGYTNLPPRKDGESIYFRYTAIAALTPLWVLAFAATMVLFVFGSVLDFVSRGVKRMFGQKTGADWHHLDVERGSPDAGHAIWKPELAMYKPAGAASPAGSSDDDLSPLPGAWSSARIWEDIKRDKGALLREKDNLDAEKAAWRLEVTRQKEEKRAFDLECQRLREERIEFQKQQQKLNADIKASAEARKEVEVILRSFIDKSQRTGQVIGGLKTRIEMLPVANGMILGNPTPPASPKTSKAEYSDYTPGVNKTKKSMARAAAIPA